MWTYSKHVLKYVYTVAPDRVILWACALPVSAERFEMPFKHCPAAQANVFYYYYFIC